MKAINIDWDIDIGVEYLPTEIDIPDGMTDEEEISDYITNETGFCHYGFEQALLKDSGETVCLCKGKGDGNS